MKAPYRWRHDPRYALAWVLCRSRGHRWEWTGTHDWCTRCGGAREVPGRVKLVVVAPDHRWGMQYVRDEGLQPREVTIVTPGQGFWVRGLRGTPVVWAGPARLTADDERALASIRH